MVVGRRALPLAGWLVLALLVVLGLALANAGGAQARAPLPDCADGIDNDRDGRIDAPFDPGCQSATNSLNDADADTSEIDPVQPPACSNGAAPDFPEAPQCGFAGDTSEIPLVVPPPCADGLDNDTPADNLRDYRADPKCLWAADPFETQRQCSNGIDDDQDGAVDFPADGSCRNHNEDNETSPAQCNDGKDNDGDGMFDFNAGQNATRDPDCSSQTDNSEAAPVIVTAPQCSDLVDNDGDGRTDFPNDPGCAFAGDSDEADVTVVPPPCADGRDNDGDGRIDGADPGCTSASDNDEFDAAAAGAQGASTNQSARLLTPFPIVRLRGSVQRAVTRITLLSVRAPARSRVSVYCTGKSCPAKRVRITAGARVVRVRRFERSLRGGTILRIYVTKPGFVGKYTRFRFVRNRPPLRVDRCARTPGTPRRCSS